MQSKVMDLKLVMQAKLRNMVSNKMNEALNFSHIESNLLSLNFNTRKYFSI